VHVVLGAILAAALLRERRRDRLPRLAGLLRWWHRGACRALGVDVVAHGRPASAPTLFACNHVSWLDIPVLGSLVPGCFLSKAEVQGWPVVGWLARRAGTLFLKRGDRHAARAATLAMTWALRRGDNVVLFPEGTTSDGSGIRRFHARLFEAAVLAGVRVQPVALRFPAGDRGDRPDPLVPFVGDDALLPHLARLAGHPGPRAEVTFLEPLEARGADRAALAGHCEALVRSVVEGERVRADAPGVGVG
jgi:1-acyl-sn-glycerol-3-phosphate acyltransferase